MNRPPIAPITNRAEFYAAENTYQHRRAQARIYRMLSKESPANNKSYARDAAKADKEADMILNMLNDYENREPEE